MQNKNNRSMKEEFLQYFKKEDFMDISTAVQVQFTSGRLTLKLEDNDWDDICFDFYVDDTYITCANSLERLKNIIELL